MTTTEHHDERFARPSMALGMSVMVLSSFGWNVIIGSGPRVPLALLGVLFLVASTVGWMWAEPRGPRVIVAWLAALVAITLVSLWMSTQGVFLIVFPVIGLGVFYGGIRGGVAVTLVVFAYVLSWNISIGNDAVQVYSNSTGMLPGATFTIIAALLVVRQRDAQRQLRRYASQVEELATTRERNRIARDIHDSVGHYLTVVHVQIEAARATVASNPTASSECLERAQDFAREGLAELRRSVSMLRTGAVDQRPFGVALAELVEESRSHGLETALEVHGTPRPLTPAIEFTLYRAAQEALTNVTRHAQATKASCTLRYRERDVALAVSDDGVGATTTQPEGGFGLLGLRERAQLVGGTVHIQTSAGRGFAVEVRVPT